MGRPAWYVVQVETGRELATVAAIERACRQADERARVAAAERAAEAEEAAAAAESGWQSSVTQEAETAAVEVERLDPAAEADWRSPAVPVTEAPSHPVILSDAKDLLDRRSPAARPLLVECFAPRYRSRFKRHGAWFDEERLLLPGYVVAVTSDPWSLARTLRGVRSLTRLLTMGETFSPLSDDDRSWIERWTREGDRTIPMSVAYKIGDRIVIAEGPLKGKEGLIRKVNRRLCQAEIEIHTGAMTIRTTVGLAVLPGGEETPRLLS